MRRSSGKKRAPKTKMRKKPMRKKTTKKGKNPWLEHAGKVFAELRKKDPKISYKQAMIEAKKTYKKQAAQPVPEIEEEWNVSSSKYSTVGKDSWNVSTSKYSTVGKKGKKKKGKSRRRRRSRRRIGGGSCSSVTSNPEIK
jgi:hypothetical protein